MKNVIETHYRRLAQKYDKFLYYSPEFVRRLTQKMVEKLKLQPSDHLVDLGCGTGMYSIDMCRQVPLEKPVLAVDPFPEMLAHIPSDAPLEPLALDALGFAEREGTYDKILMKEAVHHVEDRARLFRGLNERLAPGGRLLLVHVPPRVQYPLFRRALERCLEWHADPDELVRLLQAEGFAVDRDGLDYEHNIPKDHYLAMVEGRYMSALSSLTDEEIEAGLVEMRETYADQDMLRFVDHFDYITAVKPA